MYKKMLEEFKKTIVFLGRMKANGEVTVSGTGFLVSVGSIVHLVTAKHVIMDVSTGVFTDQHMVVLFNSKAGTLQVRSIESTKEKFKVNWIVHPNPTVDMAMIPFGIDKDKDDIKTIPDKYFMSTDRLFETYDIFFMSYQPNIPIQEKITPIIRRGTISLINNDKTLYIDANAFPGNSGSPVFLKPSPIRYDDNGVSIGSDELGGKFIGLVGSYLPYREECKSVQTGLTRIVFEENTGLTRVWTTAFMNEIIMTEQFQKQLKSQIPQSAPPAPPAP